MAWFYFLVNCSSKDWSCLANSGQDSLTLSTALKALFCVFVLAVARGQRSNKHLFQCQSSPSLIAWVSLSDFVSLQSYGTKRSQWSSLPRTRYLVFSTYRWAAWEEKLNNYGDEANQMLSWDAVAQQMGKCWEMRSARGGGGLKGHGGWVQESLPAAIFGLLGVAGRGGGGVNSSPPAIKRGCVCFPNEWAGW